MRRLLRLPAIFLIALAAFLASCGDALNRQEAGDPILVTLSISLPAARLMPAAFIHPVSYRVSFDEVAPGTRNVTVIVSQPDPTIPVPPGTWNVHVDGHAEAAGIGAILARGDASGVSINPSSTSVNVTMAYAQSGTGYLGYQVSWPAGFGVTGLYYYLYRPDSSSLSNASPIDLSTVNSYVLNFDGVLSGPYQSTIYLVNSSGLDCFIRSGSANVFDGQSTMGVIGFQPQEYIRLQPPSVSHKPGVYTNLINLILSPADPADAIWYTTDGDLPVPGDVMHGSQYTAPIGLSGPTTIRAVSYRADNTANPSAVVGWSYAFKCAPPTIAFVPWSPPNIEPYWIISTATDPAHVGSIRYTLDNGDIPDYSSGTLYDGSIPAMGGTFPPKARVFPMDPSWMPSDQVILDPGATFGTGSLQLPANAMAGATVTADASDAWHHIVTSADIRVRFSNDGRITWSAWSIVKTYNYIWNDAGTYTVFCQLDAGTGIITEFYRTIEIAEQITLAPSDFNADGVDDLLVGAYRYNNYQGRALVFQGGPAMDSSPELSMSGQAQDTDFGMDVEGLGDVNGDGFADAIIGANKVSRAFLFFGGAPMDTTSDMTFQEGDTFFGTVGRAGDLNGDGDDDIVIGAYGYNAFQGRVYVYFGGNVLDAVADVVIVGPASGSYFGMHPVGIGDFNNDGYDDLAVDALAYDSYRGCVNVYFGGAAMDGSPDVVILGAAQGDNFGVDIGAAQDFNGDTYPDLLVGANGASSGAGRVYLYRGGPSPDNVADAVFNGENAGDYFGVAVDGVGDFNNDGFVDILIGAHGFGNMQGRAYVFFGGSGADSVADVVMTGEYDSDVFGGYLRGAGDLNDDGIADIAISANGYNVSAGRVYLYWGGQAPGSIETPDLVLTGTYPEENFGYGL
jgi:hypothetical protein